MASIKTHLFAGFDPGITSCDFRGDLAIGNEQGDSHRTLDPTEIDPASPTQIDEVLADGPRINQNMNTALKSALDKNYGHVASLVHKLLGGDGSATEFGLRVGVWDD